MRGSADVIVVGLGAVGSAALYQLAKRGVRAIGVDRFAPPHAMGSTHGETRITRLATGEGAQLTPLAMRSHEFWRELEAATGRDLMTTNGGLMISEGGRPDAKFHGASFFETTLEAARRHGIAHELLDADEIRRRFPPFAVGDGAWAYYEPGAGFVRPEACVAAQLAEAARLGAEVRLSETVLDYEADAAGVAVTTTAGRLSCGALVLAVGPWAPEVWGRRMGAPLGVYRQVMTWFDIEARYGDFTPDRFPIFIWDLPHGAVYGLPAVSGPKGGFKSATESFEAQTTPETVQREVTPAEAQAMHARFVGPCFPGAGATCVRSAVCLYTTTPDFGFIVDRAPESHRVIVASPCSGHGFKHSPALGEAIADLAEDRPGRFDLSPFALARFARAEAPAGR